MEAMRTEAENFILIGCLFSFGALKGKKEDEEEERGLAFFKKEEEMR
jgi:hypothetical protein